MFRVESLAFGALDFFGSYFDGLVPDFDLDIGVCLEVVVPVRMGVGSSLGGEDQVAVAVLQVHYWVDPDFAGAGAGVVDE